MAMRIGAVGRAYRAVARTVRERVPILGMDPWYIVLLFFFFDSWT